jgi:hypothetical protein
MSACSHSSDWISAIIAHAGCNCQRFYVAVELGEHLGLQAKVI